MPEAKISKKIKKKSKKINNRKYIACHFKRVKNNRFLKPFFFLKKKQK